MQLPSIRTTNFLAFLFCALLLGIALYFELSLKLEPCPLCILQRLIFITLGILFLIGAIFHHHHHEQIYFHFFIAVIAIIGVITAGRQVWLEHLPPEQIPSCGASLKYLFQVLPFQRALQIIYQGTGSCAKVTWRFIGLSLPAWSLIFFMFFTGLSIWQGLRKNTA